jgi:hypothetical protein
LEPRLVTLDDRHLTEPDALRRLREAQERRAALATVRACIERALELIALDAADDAVDLLADALQLLEAQGV